MPDRQNAKKSTSSTRKYGLYAYGLVDREAECPDILGIDKKNKVYTVQGKDVCLIVSKVDIHQFQSQVKDLYAEMVDAAGSLQEKSAEILRAHEDVVEHIMKVTTIVPFKFGTILKDEKAVVRMLRDQEEDFRQLLAKFRGKVEYGLKVYADKQALMNHLAQSETRFAGQNEEQENLSRGTAYLLRRKREEALKEHVTAQLVQAAETIFQELGKDAADAKQNATLSQKQTGKKKDMILNAAYLVEREKAAHFWQGGQRLMEHYESMQLDLEFSGPWPPYTFM